MRLHFKISKNSALIPFDYQHLLLGVFHKWIKSTKLHDEISLYSFGWLSGAKILQNGFDFKHGAGWFISLTDAELAKKLIDSIRENPEIFNGMRVKEIYIQENPRFTEEERFFMVSPILIRKYTEVNGKKKAIHLLYDNPATDRLMTETLRHKLTVSGLDYAAEVKFDRTYSKAKTKLVTIHNIKNRASFCPVIIKGDPEAIAFAWNVGLGHSTGSGFGAIK